MNYNPYGSYIYPPHPPPPPYYNQGQWQNPGRFEDATSTQGGGLPARDTPASTNVAVNGGTNNDTTRLQQQLNALQEEMAQLRDSQNRPPRYNPYRSERYDTEYQRSYRPRYDDSGRDSTYTGDRYRDNRRDYERGSRYNPRYEYRRESSPHRSSHRSYNERDNRYSRPTTTLHGQSSMSAVVPRASNNRSLSTSVHAPSSDATITVTPLAISAHNGEGSLEFDDILYCTKDELWAAASLFNYGPADPIHPDFSWANDTGALVATGETAQLIVREGKPVIVPPIRPSDDDPAIHRSVDSAVSDAKKLIECAMKPGNFDALWEVNHLTMRAERTLHLETVLGISRENSTLPARLKAHLQMTKEHQFEWSHRLSVAPSGNPRDTRDDPPSPHPHLANPSLDEPAEAHALWLLVYGDPVNFPGVLWTQSGHVDLATVRAHLLLRRLLRGIIDERTTYTERQRIVKWNFTSHFLDIAAIPYFYGQKLTELDIVAEQTMEFRPSSSTAFERLDEVVQHLAECGVSADDMGEAYYWGQQAVLDFMARHDPATKEFQRYKRLFKRAAARLQFTNTPIVANRTWTISGDWKLDDIIAERRRRLTQFLFEQQRSQVDDHWRFARNGITQGGSARNIGNSSMNQMVQSIGNMTI
ncbi:hypothetical protein F5880DRAFT_1612052 [Lentinula raphanica]|nr:hypothetical protein F5880DRAFT_1612052 [Lentinula raphanica]